MINWKAERLIRAVTLRNVEKISGIQIKKKGMATKTIKLENKFLRKKNSLLSP